MGYFAIDTSPDLKHYGVLGMKWGVRRYENSDGTLTAAGKKRYKHMYKHGKVSKTTDKAIKEWQKLSRKDFFRKYAVSKDEYERRVAAYGDPYKNSPLSKWAKDRDRTGLGMIKADIQYAKDMHKLKRRRKNDLITAMEYRS